MKYQLCSFSHELFNPTDLCPPVLTLGVLCSRILCSVFRKFLIKDMAVEDPGDSPIISASFGMRQMMENSTDFLPFFGTDFGFCSLVKPQLNFDEKYSNLSFRDLYGPTSETSSYSREIKRGVKVGKANGLRLLLDAETFDYTFHKSASEGKVDKSL